MGLGIHHGFSKNNAFRPVWSCMRKKILVVDDDLDLLALLKLYFEDKGFFIATSTNGIDALKQARSLSPDLILLDLVLPGLDGFSVCETLRQDRITAAIPILMMTGLTGQLDHLVGMDCGANDYVTKPVTTENLFSKVTALLDGSSASPSRRKGAKSEFPGKSSSLDLTIAACAKADETDRAKGGQPSRPRRA